MKKIALFGAGQIGAAVLRLLGSSYAACCFADNAEEKWGGNLAGIPIVSPQESLLFSPDCFVLCVLDEERSSQMRAQLTALGLRLIAEQAEALPISGDVAELGVFRGDFAAMINAAFPKRTLHLFDTFDGFAARDIEQERANGFSRAKCGDFSDTSVEVVAARLPHGEMAVFRKGCFPDSFHGCEGLRFAFVSIDADLYAPTAAALPLFWDRLSPGGALMIHDVYSTQFRGVRQAVDEFCGERGLLPLPVCDLHGSAVLRKALH